MLNVESSDPVGAPAAAKAGSLPTLSASRVLKDGVRARALRQPELDGPSVAVFEDDQGVSDVVATDADASLLGESGGE